MDTGITMSWLLGAYALSHDVYLGENFDDVNDGIPGAPGFRGNQTSASYVAGLPGFTYPDGLVPGTTYYWRIDEVNDADPNSPWKGPVWSFSVPPKMASDPPDGAASVDPNMTLSWMAGIGATSHTVYFDDDFDAVASATGGSVVEITSSDPGPVELGKTYYWRIDESDDVDIYKGDVWSFTVGGSLLVDDFEEYTDDDGADEAIWQSWIGGAGMADNGAQVGYLLPPYAEQTIVRGGSQSIPILYNNTAGVTNSEVALRLTAPRDWTEHNVTDLSLWFRGLPGSMGSFTEEPVGTYTMTGSGAAIWNNGPRPGEYHDEFHFAYKTLTGAGSITAKIESVRKTQPLATVGVMIRETLDGGSKHRLVGVTPDRGVFSMGRAHTANASFYASEGGITAPHWLKLERNIDGQFSVSHSADGITWQPVSGEKALDISMGSDVYIGLALTSHTRALTCEAVFSNVTTTGTVGTQWMNQDIGILSNAAEPLYVAVSDADGVTAVVAYDDPVAAQINTWTEWIIPLQAFSDQGIDLIDVDKIAIGLGTKSGKTGPGGSGTMYIDNIELY
jgi:hypothetical protein